MRSPTDRHRTKSRRNRKRRQRRLTLESLESRQLMDAAPTYTYHFDVREDLTLNGFDSADPYPQDVYISVTDIRGWDGESTQDLTFPVGEVPFHGGIRRDNGNGTVTITLGKATPLPDITVLPGGTLTLPPINGSPNTTYGFSYEIISTNPNNQWLPSSSLDKRRVNLRPDKLNYGRTITLHQKVDISGQVFEDLNGDGIRQENELLGIRGLSPTRTKHPDSDGFFSFQANPSAPWHVQPWSYISPQSGLSKFISTTVHAPIPMLSGMQHHVEIGAFQLASLTGSIFHDTNANGVRDHGERPAENVSVIFDTNGDGLNDGSFIGCIGLDIEGEEICASTDASGIFTLDGGKIGDRLEILSPSPSFSWHVTTPDAFVVTQSGQNEFIRIGVTRGRDISGRVYTDVNRNGKFDSDVDRPIGNADVILDFDDAGGSFEAITQTDAETGIYRFQQVPPGKHRLLPALNDYSDITQPNQSGYLINVPTDLVESTVFDIGVVEFAKFKDGSTIDVVAPNELQDHPDVHNQKLLLWQQIYQGVDAIDDSRREQVRDFMNRVIARNPSTGYIPVSIDTLARLKKFVEAANDLIDQQTQWSLFVDLTGEDIGRLADVGNTFVERMFSLVIDPYYREELAENGWKIAGAISDAIAKEAALIKEDYDRRGKDLIREVIEITLEDLSKAETYEKLVKTLFAVEQFKKAFDPKVPVEARLGNLISGYVELLGTASGASGAARLGTRSLLMLDRVAAKSAMTGYVQKLAVKMFDNPGAGNAATQAIVKYLTRIQAGKVKTLKAVKSGAVVPSDLLHEMGYTQRQIEALTKIAKDRKVSMRFRTTNTKSTTWIKTGKAVEKPLDIKAKTINHIDVYLGFDPGHQGLVGMKRPLDLIEPLATSPCINRNKELCSVIRKRYKQRFNESRELFEKLDAEKFRVLDDGRVINISKNKPIAGDIDPVSFVDEHGNHLTGDAYDRLVDELKSSGARIQHGAETNVVDDILRARDPRILEGSPEYNEIKKNAEQLFHKLEEAHLSGKETTIEFHHTGTIHKVDVTNLASVGRAPSKMLIRGLSKPSTGADSVPRVVEGSGLTLEKIGQMGVNNWMDDLADRAAAGSQQVLQLLQRQVGPLEFSAEEIRAMDNQQLVEFTRMDPSGVEIDTGAEGLSGAEQIAKRMRDAAGSPAQEFVVRKLEGSRFSIVSRQSQESQYDVSGDGFAAPVDALKILNRINTSGAVELNLWPTSEDVGLDTSGNNLIEPLDALQVINYLNRRGSAEAEVAFSGSGDRASEVDRVMELSLGSEFVPNVGSRHEIDRDDVDDVFADSRWYSLTAIL